MLDWENVERLFKAVGGKGYRSATGLLEGDADWRELKSIVGAACAHEKEPAEAEPCVLPHGHPAGGTLGGLLHEVEECGYTCEAGLLQHNVCWQELKKRVQKWEKRLAEETVQLESGRGDYDLEALIRKVESLYAGEVDPIRWNDYWRELKLRMRKWRQKETADATDLGKIAAMAAGRDNSRMEKGAQMFHDVLQRVCTQVFSGKGEKRHGLGRPLLEQPAFRIRKVCEGYCVGQALKKIMEAQEAPLDFEGRMQELIDAVAYLVFEMVYMEV